MTTRDFSEGIKIHTSTRKKVEKAFAILRIRKVKKPQRKLKGEEKSDQRKKKHLDQRKKKR